MASVHEVICDACGARCDGDRKITLKHGGKVAALFPTISSLTDKEYDLCARCMSEVMQIVSGKQKADGKSCATCECFDKRRKKCERDPNYGSAYSYKDEWDYCSSWKMKSAEIVDKDVCYCPSRGSSFDYRGEAR